MLNDGATAFGNEDDLKACAISRTLPIWLAAATSAPSRDGMKPRKISRSTGCSLRRFGCQSATDSKVYKAASLCRSQQPSPLPPPLAAVPLPPSGDSKPRLQACLQRRDAAAYDRTRALSIMAAHDCPVI